LHQLLARLTAQTWHRGDEYALAPPHEALRAQALGWPDCPVGQTPWAAHWARADGLAVQDHAWGLLTPCHWLMGRDQLTVVHPDALNLGEGESRALFEAVWPLFDGEGWSLHWGAPTRWYVSHESLADLPTASLDRVVGRNPDVWMPQHPQARLIRRLQAEVQMVLYQHPVNDERLARGELSVNSFWLSGCGRAPVVQTARSGADLMMLEGPGQALLRGDMPAWLAAWQDLDGQALAHILQAAQAGQSVALTLCGERHALTVHSPPPSPWWRLARLRLRPRPVLPSSLLGSL
jgi:hypothetical protein